MALVSPSTLSKVNFIVGIARKKFQEKSGLNEKNVKNQEFSCHYILNDIIFLFQIAMKRLVCSVVLFESVQKCLSQIEPKKCSCRHLNKKGKKYQILNGFHCLWYYILGWFYVPVTQKPRYLLLLHTSTTTYPKCILCFSEHNT